MPLLYYWRPDNYLADREFGFGYHLNQGSPALVRTTRGDSVWAFTRRAWSDGAYVLAAELVVQAVTANPPGYRYGPHRLWADVDRTRYFEVDAGQSRDVEHLVRTLGIHANAAVLAQAFQGHSAVRAISVEAHQLLATFASDLPTEERVAFYAEDELEARAVYGDLTPPLADAAASVREDYLRRKLNPARLRANTTLLQEMYDGRCQVCALDPRTLYGTLLCHGHHIEWISRGGDDAIENMALLCPTHHVAAHKSTTVFDFATLEFRFPTGRVEPIVLNKHLRQAC